MFRNFIIIVASLFALTTQPASTSGFLWESTNPGGGGAFNHVAVSPSGIVVVGSDLGGAYRSLDRGQTWNAIGARQGLYSTHVSSVGFDKHNTLYLGTDDGLYRSGDQGSSFQAVLGDGYIPAIAVDGQIGYAAYHSAWNSADATIHKTTNGGYNWSQVSVDLPSNLALVKLVLHPSNPNIIYALAGESRFACSDALLYRSTNGGVNWARLGSQLGQILDVALDAHNPAIVHLTTHGDIEEGYNCLADDPNGGNLYQSSNGGDSWTLIANRTGTIWDNAADPASLRLINLEYPYVWDDRSGVWEYDGVTWQHKPIDNWDSGWSDVFWGFGRSFDGHVKTLGIDPSDPDALWWVNTQFVYATFDGGEMFTSMVSDRISAERYRSRKIDNVVPASLAFGKNGVVYAGYYDMGCFRSLDNGASWQNCNDETYAPAWHGGGGNVMTIVADPDRAGVVWQVQVDDLGNPMTLVRSDDAGGNWQPSNNNLPQSALISGLSIDPNSPTNQRTLFVTVDGDVYVSGVDGWGWDLMFDCDGCFYTAVDQFDSNIVYAGGTAGLFRSTDGGWNWHSFGTSAMQGGWDGDSIWYYDYSGITDITPSLDQSGVVYVAAHGFGKGIWAYDGASWTKTLTDDYAWGVTVAADGFYVATSSARHAGGYSAESRGLLHSTDGTNWQSANANLAWPFATLVETTPSGTVWAGSPGEGFVKAQRAAYKIYLPINFSNQVSR